MIRRNPAPYSLDAHRVQARGWDGEPVPELFLELREHALDGDHKYALASSPDNEFAPENTRFDGLTKAHVGGDQDPLTRLAERLAGSIELVWYLVHGSATCHPDAMIVGHRAA